MERLSLVTIGPARRPPLDGSAPRPDRSPLVTSSIGVLQSRLVSRTMRAALTVLLAAIAAIAPLTEAGMRPAFARTIAVADDARSLAAPLVGAPFAVAPLAAPPAGSPSDGPADASPSEDGPPAEPIVAEPAPVASEPSLVGDAAATPPSATPPASETAATPPASDAAVTPPASETATPPPPAGVAEAASPPVAPATAAPSMTGPSPAAPSTAAPSTYVVQPKDTMFSIARRHGVTVDAVLWANNLTDANVLKDGQKLTIPPSSGKLYAVKDGDTLEAVAKANAVSPSGIAAVNGLAEGAPLAAGQRLLIPAPRQAVIPDAPFASAPAAPAPVVAAQVAPPSPISPAALSPAGPAVVVPAPPPSLVPAAAPLVRPGTPTPSPSGPASVTITTRKLPELQWPIELKAPRIVITTPFRPVAVGPKFDDRKHDGIDISAPGGHPVKAAADGTVKRAETGWNGGYGTLVVVDHGDGITSWYAHLSEMAVVVGDKVQVGQKVGSVGDTGESRGMHLHFEMRINSTPVNPMLALP